MKQNYLKTLALAIVLFSSFTLKAENVTIKFAQGVQHATTAAYLINPATSQEEKLTAATDGFTYSVPSGGKVRFEAVPNQGYVTFVWTSGKDENNMEEIRESYSSKEQIIDNIKSNMVVTVDVCKLVPATFIVPSEGSRGAEVNVEEQGDYGRVIASEADGITYMLPENRGAYFDPRPMDGYNILAWSFGENAYFPSCPDQFYKNNVPAGFYLTLSFYKDGETRTVTYTQPKTAKITCYNRSEFDSPTIESGAKVTPGNQILFEAAPLDNPSGKVAIHHWIVNGKPYVDASGEYFVENSLFLKAIDNLDVQVVPEAEYTGINTVATSQDMIVAAHGATLSVANCKGLVSIYNLQGSCLGQQTAVDGKAAFNVQGCGKGTVIVVVAGSETQKVVL